MGLWTKEFNISYIKFSTQWVEKRPLSGRYSEIINSTRLLISSDPWHPRLIRGRTGIVGWFVSWRMCPCTHTSEYVCVYMWLVYPHCYNCCVRMYGVYCMCVSVCACTRKCVLSAVFYRHTHTHLSRRVRFSPNGTIGIQNISIFKGDILQSESCSRE